MVVKIEKGTDTFRSEQIPGEWIQKEIDWLVEVLTLLNSINKAESGVCLTINDISPPVPDEENCFYAQLIDKYNFGFEERIALILSLCPEVCPKVLDVFKVERKYTAFGGIIGKNHHGFIPTGETLMFILAGNDLSKRFELLKLFSKDHVFYRDNLVYLEEPLPGEPELSGVLTPSKDLIDLVTRGQVRKPDLSPDFPAKLITTEMEWNDLVVAPHTAVQLQEMEQWIKFQPQLVKDKNLGRKIKPGFKTLFYGPPGTGKTLAACIIGKKTGRDVYRIDLSTLVSKYIGETEKNLRKLFDRAERKDWILFFDEADAIFGKRTSVSDAHDRYANQEVSYLLQRIEYHEGLVILATNMKTNIDNAFMRRFQCIVHFPMPKPEERLKLWKNSLPENVVFDESLNLNKIASDFELSGAHIVNVVSHCSLKMMSEGNMTLTQSMLRDGVARELAKEGRTI